MEIIIFILSILILMTLSLLATHLWIGFWDTIIHRIKKLLGIHPKKETNWHSLKKDEIEEDDSLY